MTVRTNDKMMPSYTVISNEFIDSYMPSANGEYVKVYLYILRAGGDASCEEIADALEMTSSDAARAVNYWSKRGLLSLHEDAAPEADAAPAANMSSVIDEASMAEAAAASKADSVYGRTAADGDVETAADARKNAEAEIGKPMGARQETEAAAAAIDIEKLQDDEEFASLLYCLQKYMGRTFGQKDVESLGYIYDGLHMDSKMIEYLAEVCVKRGRTSSRYMEAIARDWAGKGITTVDAAKAETSQYGSQIWTVMRAFGLNDRKPAQVETEYVEKWFGTYAMPEEMVKEAISRTMEAIHKPSFAYADSILEKWHTAGVHSLQEIEPLDKEHERRSRAQAQDAGGHAKPRTTGFSNFEQRDTDLESGMLAMLKDKL